VPGNLRSRYSRSRGPFDQLGQTRKHDAKADRHRENGEHERGHSGRGHTGYALGVDPHAAAFLLGCGVAATAGASPGFGVAAASGAPGAAVLPG